MALSCHYTPYSELLHIEGSKIHPKRQPNLIKIFEHLFLRFVQIGF